jgi:predicted RNase H-like HicB family nuclease
LAVRRYRVDLCFEDDGLWSAVVPALPGCSLTAETRAEAFDAMNECAQVFIDVLVSGGRPLPPEDFDASMDFITIDVTV